MARRVTNDGFSLSGSTQYAPAAGLLLAPPAEAAQNAWRKWLPRTLHQTVCVQNKVRHSDCEQTHRGDAAPVQKMGLQEIGLKRRRQNNKAPHFPPLFICSHLFFPVIHFYQSQVKVWACKPLMNEEQSCADTNYVGCSLTYLLLKKYKKLFMFVCCSFGFLFSDCFYWRTRQRVNKWTINTSRSSESHVLSPLFTASCEIAGFSFLGRGQY